MLVHYRKEPEVYTILYYRLLGKDYECLRELNIQILYTITAIKTSKFTKIETTYHNHPSSFEECEKGRWHSIECKTLQCLAAKMDFSRDIIPEYSGIFGLRLNLLAAASSDHRKEPSKSVTWCLRPA